MNDEGSLREELLAAQMRYELGEMSDEEFAELESDILAPPARDPGPGARGGGRLDRRHVVPARGLRRRCRLHRRRRLPLLPLLRGRLRCRPAFLPSACTAARAASARPPAPPPRLSLLQKRAVRSWPVSTDPAHSLGDAFAARLSPEPVRLKSRGGRLLAAELDVERALGRWMAERRETLKTIAERGTYLDDQDLDRLLALSLPGADELVGMLELERLGRESWRAGGGGGYRPHRPHAPPAAHARPAAAPGRRARRPAGAPPRASLPTSAATGGPTAPTP